MTINESFLSFRFSHIFHHYIYLLFRLYTFKFWWINWKFKNRIRHL